jgi:uncharacterized membrane protein
MDTNKLYLYIRILATFGVILAVYLLWQQVFRPDFQICNFSETVNCDAIISGPVAKTLGIPTPLYGLIGYTVIYFAAVLRKSKLMLGMATFGLLFCLWIGYRELFELNVVCPVCIGCQLTMISVFALSFIVNRRGDK